MAFVDDLQWGVTEVGWLSQVQHWWLWLLVALIFGGVGIFTGSLTPLCIALGALAAALASVVFPGVAEWMAFLFVTCGIWMFSSALSRRRRSMLAADPDNGEGKDAAVPESTKEDERRVHRSDL